MPISNSDERLDKLFVEKIMDDMKKEVDVSRGMLASEESGEFVSGDQRDRTVAWLLRINTCNLGFNFDTMSLGIHLLDRLLSTVKIRRRYVDCCGLSALLLAAKMIEQADNVPSYALVLKLTKMECSANDIKRMEAAILSKVEGVWSPHIYTFVMSYLHMLSFQYDRNVCSDLKRFQNSLWARLFNVMSNHHIVAIQKPSRLALAVLSLWLERSLPDSRSFTESLLRDLSIPKDEYIEARMALTHSSRLLRRDSSWLPTIHESSEESEVTNVAPSAASTGDRCVVNG